MDSTVMSVPTLSIVFMIISMLVGILLPLGLFIYCAKVKKTKQIPFWIGAGVFVVFALILEQLFQLPLVFSGAITQIQANLWLNGIIGGLYAGVFEETGRYLAMRFMMKQYKDNDTTSIMYGAGHGGIESVLLLTFTMASNAFFAISVNSGAMNATIANLTDSATIESLTQSITTLATTEPPMFLMAMVERIAAVALHVSLSVLVWFSVTKKKKFYLFPLAVFLHAFMDAVAVIMSKLINNLWAVEGIIWLISIISIAIAVICWKKYGGKYEVAVANDADATENTDDANEEITEDAKDSEMTETADIEITEKTD